MGIDLSQTDCIPCCIAFYKMKIDTQLLRISNFRLNVLSNMTCHLKVP
uniref:Uncharacterized protein n=1 Tax=Rhizophora mucronata TaxID=61149 RepID=A0A2P2Q0F5_RHIMU